MSSGRLSRERGTLAEDEEGVTLTFRRVYPHAIEHVWEAVSTAQGLSAWLLAKDVSIEARVGGRFEMRSGPAGYASRGRVLAWDPPRCLAYEWNVAPTPEMPHGERATFRFELDAKGSETQLVVVYRRLTKETARGFIVGVHAFLDRLEAQLDGASLPDFVERFAALAPHYPEWRGHASHPGQ